MRRALLGFAVFASRASGRVVASRARGRAVVTPAKGKGRYGNALFEYGSCYAIALAANASFAADAGQKFCRTHAAGTAGCGNAIPVEPSKYLANRIWWDGRQVAAEVARVRAAARARRPTVFECSGYRQSASYFANDPSLAAKVRGEFLRWLPSTTSRADALWSRRVLPAAAVLGRAEFEQSRRCRGSDEDHPQRLQPVAMTPRPGRESHRRAPLNSPRRHSERRPVRTRHSSCCSTIVLATLTANTVIRTAIASRTRRFTTVQREGFAPLSGRLSTSFTSPPTTQKIGEICWSPPWAAPVRAVAIRVAGRGRKSSVADARNTDTLHVVAAASLRRPGQRLAGTGDTRATLVAVDDPQNPQATLAALARCDAATFSHGTYSWWVAFLTGGRVLYDPGPWLSARCSVSRKGTKDPRVSLREHVPRAWVPLPA